MRRAAVALLGVLALFLLSGCFKVDMDLEVNADDTVDGSMVVALDQEMYAMMDSGDEDMLGTDDLPEGAEVEDYEADGMKGQKVTFTDVPLAELRESMGEDSGEFSLTHEGDEYVFEATMAPDEVTGGAAGSGDELEGMDEMVQQMLEGAEVTVAITFPGDIQETNGEQDGNTVSWDLDLTETTEMRAVASDSGGFPVLAVVMAVLAALILGAGAWFLFLRKPRVQDGTPGDTASSDASGEPSGSQAGTGA